MNTIKQAQEAVDRIAAKLSVLHEDREPIVAAIMAATALAIAEDIDIVREALKGEERPPLPVRMILFCPACGAQHIDEPEAEDDDYWASVYAGRKSPRWTNPPHRSHLCYSCDHVWQPADVPTTGVKEIRIEGESSGDACEALAALREAAPAPQPEAAQPALMSAAWRRIDTLRANLQEADDFAQFSDIQCDSVKGNLRELLGLLEATLPLPAQPVQQAPSTAVPSRADSKTLPSELWKNPLLPIQQRLQIADGAVQYRDKIIKNIHGQLAAQSAPSTAVPSRAAIEDAIWKVFEYGKREYKGCVKETIAELFSLPAVPSGDAKDAQAVCSPFEGGTAFMVGMDSLLRQAEAFDGGKVSTEAVRNFILSFQPTAAMQPPNANTDGASND